MARIEGGNVIGRPVGVVSDYVPDQSNAPQYNLRMVRARKITAEPMRKGTQFCWAVTSVDAFGRDGIRITRNWISRSREAPQCRSGRSQS